MFVSFYDSQSVPISLPLYSHTLLLSTFGSFPPSNHTSFTPIAKVAILFEMAAHKKDRPSETAKGQAGSTSESAQPVFIKREPEKTLFSWEAPSRPFKRRGKEFWATSLAIASVVSLILLLIEGVISVILVIALVFLFYILSTVKPETVEYKITSRGIKIADRLTPWRALTRYWFSHRLGSSLLIFEMINLPGRLELVINKKDKSKIKKSLLNYIFEEKAPATNLDKVSSWLSKKFPQG